MQAVIHETFGAPAEVLRIAEARAPEIGENDVLVRVRSAAVARGDWLIASGLPYIARPSYGVRRPRQRVAGIDVAGVVEAVGAAVTRFAPGDQVVGWGQGTLAEYASVPESQLTPKPEQIGFEQAAAIPTSGITALQAIRDKGGVAEGDRVLVIGAAGGVGSFAVQIAKGLGAEVTGVASTRNLDFIRSLGADHVIDYTAEEIGDGGRQFDVIVDLAGNRPLAELRRAMTSDGTLVIVGGSGGRTTMGFGRTLRAALMSPFVSQRLVALIAQPGLADLESLTEMVGSGALSPAVGATYPLTEAPSAVAHAGAGRGHGKTVVTV